MITRVQAWGCSFTWGEGLDPPRLLGRQTASAAAWPSLVAQSLGVPLLNHAEPGASNVWIADRITGTEFAQGDLVLIMWTWPQRTTRNIRQQQHQHILANSRSDLFEHWLRVHTDTDITVMDGLFRTATRHCLDRQSVQCLELDVRSPQCAWADLPLGWDHSHPGHQWHQRISDQILVSL